MSFWIKDGEKLLTDDRLVRLKDLGTLIYWHKGIDRTIPFIPATHAEQILRYIPKAEMAKFKTSAPHGPKMPNFSPAAISKRDLCLLNRSKNDDPHQLPH